MIQKPEQNNSIYNKLSMFSIMAGILALTSCCYPPVQLVFGVAAVMLAWLSRNGEPMAVPSVIGMIMGIVSVVLSVLIFLQYIWAMKFMGDPANAAMVKDFYQQYQDIFNSLLPTQPVN